MPAIELTDITKSYGGPAAVGGVTLRVEDGDFMCLLGPSGCGKTTMLRMLAGLETATAGRIAIGNRVVDCPATGVFVGPEKRKLGLVFQSYALWPHMTVARNIEFGLRLRKIPAAQMRAEVAEVMEKLSIAKYADRYPSQLSGGQQQRVALARMLAVRPDVLLLDEPLSNLDAALRLEMRAELRRIHEEFRTTIVFVTHDQWEAMTLATRIAVMKDGLLQQVGTPDDIYARPANSFVARFIGNPPINMIDGAGDLGRSLGGAPLIGLRPEDIRLGHGQPATVRSVMPTGGSWMVELAVGVERLLHSTQTRPDLRAGQPVLWSIAPDHLHHFDINGSRLQRTPQLCHA
ncbi:ABC transporter ATP-binding protein [Falsirhodobacter xinxiangensis]|uniref:ABC transporter ATP-binding protein n=1 Tax=Falsirhodobacter xinxiangensis TaxID=2530049 RepID=UPI0010AB1FC5|nr:ABC transporter ATP-binding protein [Rhodobacter xinxiangensis]